MITLLYHNILELPANGVPVAAEQPSIEAFRRQIHSIRHRLLHPREVHDELVSGRIPRGILLTFDDGATGILDAARILASVGAVGVAFVCPGALTNGLWFYRLARALARTIVGLLTWRDLRLSLRTKSEKQDAYSALFDRLFDLPGNVRDHYLEEILSGIAPSSPEKPHRVLSTFDAEGLRAVADTNAMVFANHSWSHPNLTALPPMELEREIEAAQDWLRCSGLPVLPWFAFPVGKHNELVRQTVTKYCPVAFGATPCESQVLPRIGVYRADCNRLRFSAKIALEGRISSFVHRLRT